MAERIQIPADMTSGIPFLRLFRSSPILVLLGVVLTLVWVYQTFPVG